MAVQVYWLRPTSSGAVPYKSWKDDAACNGSDPKLFELDNPVRWMSGVEEEQAYELIAQGLKICSNCPVRSACKLNSNEEDRYWTTRGGQPPEGLFPDTDHPDTVRLRSNPQKGGRKRAELCPKGHNNWRERGNGSRRCVDCAREDDKSRPRRGRAKKKCRKGHENWAERPGNQTGRYCVDCKRADNVKRGRERRGTIE